MAVLPLLGGALKWGGAGLQALMNLYFATELYGTGKALLSGASGAQERETTKAMATLSESQRMKRRLKTDVTLDEGNVKLLEQLRSLAAPGNLWMGEGRPMPGQMRASEATRAVGLSDDRIAFANALAEQLGPQSGHKTVKATDLLKAAMIPRTGGAYG